MKIKSIRIQNFRCISDLTIPFEEDLNVFVALNGCGKTTVMDAIAAGFAPYLGGILNVVGGEISKKDIRKLPDGSFPGDLEIEVELFDGTTWKMPLTFVDSPDEDLKLQSHFHELEQGLKAKLLELRQKTTQNAASSDVIPVIAYYRSTRNLGKAPKPQSTEKNFTRLEVLGSSLDAISSYQDVIDWLFAKDGEELRANRDTKNPMPLKDLECVRKAVMTVLKPAEAIYFTATTPAKPALRWRENGGEPAERLIGQLSDGYRNMLALVMDFARRLAQANPQLDNPLETEAIMLVDEIDLHLHPSWQQTILSDLAEAFPKTQIIVTTHSPQVLTSVKSQSIRILDNGQVRSAPPGSYGAESVRMLERIMGTKSRPPGNPQAEKIKRLMQNISDNKLGDAEILLKELQEFYQGNEPSLDEAEMAIENRKWEESISK